MKPNTDLPDLAGAARRERFEAVYAAHRAHLLRYVLRRTDGADDAADVVAETFLVVWRRLDDAPVEDVHLWLYGVARRVLANHRRGERRRTRLADQLQSDLASCEAAPDGQQEFAELAAAFRSLPDGDREVLALEAWEQLDAGEIAAVLGCSRNAARIRLHRARRRLRAAIAASRGPSRQPAMRSRPAQASPPQASERQVRADPGHPPTRCAADVIGATEMVVSTGDIS
ncbi:MAG: sigma-70 family RNA polymerase sigma factor [Actinomycetota bacterium]|nr:sigma-70 family RNA polymerase sigma factor [Actinomycetota bacterium]